MEFKFHSSIVLECRFEWSLNSRLRSSWRIDSIGVSVPDFDRLGGLIRLEFLFLSTIVWSVGSDGVFVPEYDRMECRFGWSLCSKLRSCWSDDSDGVFIPQFDRVGVKIRMEF